MHLRQGPPGKAKDHRPEGIYPVGAEKHRYHRRWPRRYRQDVFGRGGGGAGVPGKAGEPHHPDPSGGGGRERLGFLPGDLQSKVDPYLRPLYDALFDMLGAETYQKYLERGNIEVAPLAYMRGRTLDDSFIILDEAQNTSREQMKMFLTRMGFGSRVVVTGDTSQIDLPVNPSSGRARSGLVHALAILDKIPGLAVHHFSKADVVRHPLVGAIVNAYDNAEKDS